MESLNSEGITFKRPKQTQTNVRSGNGKRKRLPPEDPFEALSVNIIKTFDEPLDSVPRRMKYYKRSLDIIDRHLKLVQENNNKELSGNLDKFIKSSFHLIEKDPNVLSIGILESGLSVGENSAIFDYIQGKLRDLRDALGERVYVARLQSGSSLSTKAVFQKICNQIASEEPLEEGPLGRSPTKKEKHYSLYDVKTLLSKDLKYKIVIIVEDVDHFSNLVISQLLTLMGCAKLSAVFILGTTHGQFVNNLIPLSSSSAFVVEKFYSVSPKDRYDDLMRRVLFDNTNPFRISGPIVASLESQYMENNFSVDYICNAIKYCLRTHFLTCSSTFCTLDNSEIFTEVELDLLKELALHAAEESPRKRKKVTSVKIVPQDLLTSTIDGLKHWYFVLKLLCVINFRLPDYPLGNSYSRIYITCYEGYLTSKEAEEDDVFHKFFRAINSLPKVQLEKLISDCIEVLNSGKMQTNTDLVSDIVVNLKELLEEIVLGETQKDRTTLGNSEETALHRLKKKKPKNIQELQQSLLEAKRQSDGTFVIHNVRTKLTDYIRDLLKRFFPPFTSLQCSSAFVFSNLTQFVTALFPANFLMLNEDIINPGYVLQCECCVSLDSSSIDVNLPDVCIIHKLISEHTTKKVDLNSIYYAFVSVVQPSGRQKKSKKDTETASFLTRFRRAVGELQHMGFIKRSKSKPDEINRLTWW